MTETMTRDAAPTGGPAAAAPPNVDPDLVRRAVDALTRKAVEIWPWPHGPQESTRTRYRISVTERGNVQVDFLRRSIARSMASDMQALGFAADRLDDASLGWGVSVLVRKLTPLHAHYEVLDGKLLVVCARCHYIFSAPLSAVDAIVECADCPAQLHLDTRAPLT